MKGLCTIKFSERLNAIKGGRRCSIHTSESSSHCGPPIKASSLLLVCQCRRKNGKKGHGTVLQVVL